MLHVKIIPRDELDSRLETHTAELIDEAGKVFAAGHLVVDAQVAAGSGRVESSLRFVGALVDTNGSVGRLTDTGGA